MRLDAYNIISIAQSATMNESCSIATRNGARGKLFSDKLFIYGWSFRHSCSTSPLMHPLCQPWTNITVSMLIWGISNLFSSPVTFNFVQFPIPMFKFIPGYTNYAGAGLRRWREEGHGLCQLKLHSELREHKFFSITLVVRQKNTYIHRGQCCIWL